jgi:DNA replication protein DnaC
MRAFKDIDRQISGIAGPLREKLRQLFGGVSPWPLYLFGDPGRGKTRAGLCCCDVAWSAMYATVEEICDWTMPTNANPAALRCLDENDLAIVDELGTRMKAGDLEYMAIKRIADARDGRPTIWISNLTPEKLEVQYDYRMASRLLCGTIFELTGPDRRKT